MLHREVLPHAQPPNEFRLIPSHQDLLPQYNIHIY